jgi:undecaprenyl-diphosphatase
MFNRARPFLKIESLHVKKISVDDYSFPSAHSAVSFSMGIMASAFFPQLGSIFITLASLVAISRVYIGVHYPTDVIIGIIIGTSCSIFI